MADAIISRDEALAQGLLRYFTGEPCKHGHVAERYVKNRACLECNHITQINKPRKQRKRADPEERKRRRRAASLKHAKANREKKRVAERLRRLADPERERARKQAWRTANPDKARLIPRRRRLRLKAVEGHHTAEDIQRIHKAQKGKCALCRAKLGTRYEVDHITPLKAGGTNWPRNLQLTCPECNRTKGMKDPITFAQSLGLLV